MLQIVKDGKTSFLGCCKKCGCDFSYDLADLRNGPGGALYVQCPCCEYVYYHPDQGQDFTIFSPPYTDTTTITPYTGITCDSDGTAVNTPFITIPDCATITSVSTDNTKPIEAVMKIRKDHKWVPVEFTNHNTIKEMQNGKSTVIVKRNNDIKSTECIEALSVGDIAVIHDINISDYYVSKINIDNSTITFSKLVDPMRLEIL